LKGDLHLHTKYSDGKFTVEQTAKFSKQSGYDFIAITDHNTTAQNRDPYKDSELIMIPGMELTMANGIGHSNIIGIPDPKPAGDMKLKEEIASYFADAKGQGALVQINHPFNRKYYWGVGLDMDFSTIELWNGEWNDEDFQALEWWQEQLKAGKKIVATAGSDTHTIDEYRYPFNNVYSVSKDVNDILNAIKDGNLYLSVSAEGPGIEINCGDAIMGETVPYKENKEIHINVSNLLSGDEVEIISDNGSEYKESVSGDNFSKKMPMEKRMFYRVEVHRPGKVASLSNPLYISSK
jgi:predicted metal-dependent phosphoesterase TrpH